MWMYVSVHVVSVYVVCVRSSMVEYTCHGTMPCKCGCMYLFMLFLCMWYVFDRRWLNIFFMALYLLCICVFIRIRTYVVFVRSSMVEYICHGNMPCLCGCMYLLMLYLGMWYVFDRRWLNIFVVELCLVYVDVYICSLCICVCGMCSIVDG